MIIRNGFSFMKKLTLLWLLLPLLSVSISAQSHLNQYVVVAKNFVQPILKYKTENPVTRVDVYVPGGTKDAQLQKLYFSVNAQAVNAIDYVDVYYGGNESVFNAKYPKTTVKVNAKNSIVALETKLNVGWNYIWLSPVLTHTADIDTKIAINPTKVMVDKRMIAIKNTHPIVENYTGIALRNVGDDGVHTYRIPGLVTTSSGTLIAVYDIRYDKSGDLPGNIDVGMSRSTDGGRTWEPMKVIMDMGGPNDNSGIGDPAILYDSTSKTLWCAALWSKGNRSLHGSQPGLSPDESGQFVLVKSEDDGKTWSEPINITAQVKNPIWHIYFNGPGRGIVMKDGTLVFASQYWDETTTPSKIGIPHSSIIYSKDKGKTWQSGIGAKSNTTEAQVVELSPGTLMLNMRDNRGKFRSVAITKDLGKTWTEHLSSQHELIDPICQASLLKASMRVDGKQKDILLFSNVANRYNRVDMTVKASLNLGESWSAKNEKLIDYRPSYGYSCLTKIDDNTIGLIYEGVRELYFIRIPIKDLIK